MSRRDLKKYLHTLNKEQLEDQIFDLYLRFEQVKTFYNFVFKPEEDKLLEEAKFKISKEYFPINSRKPKARRSVAQKVIKYFKQLGVDPAVIMEIMLFNIEIAQQFAKEKTINQEAFFKSIFKSFEDTLNYIFKNGGLSSLKIRLTRIVIESKEQNWDNFPNFEISFNKILEESYLNTKK